MSQIAIRPPSFSSAKQPANFTSPTIAWLSEEWHVTHSTLPMWKNKRNVRIKYTPLPPSAPTIPEDRTDRIDDLVTYQSSSGDKVNTVRGVDKCASKRDERSEWDWRGRGLLKLASSHWEVLGYGEEDGSGNKWVVTMFAKTLFTPAGIDVYSRDGKGLQEATLAGIKGGLAAVEDADVKKMAEQLFEIMRDEAREG